MRGFNEILPAATFLHFFDPSELELMISGLPEVDIEDMRANTTYSGYASTDATIGHFWTVLRSFTAEEKALFVQFVTGSSKVRTSIFTIYIIIVCMRVQGLLYVCMPN